MIQPSVSPAKGESHVRAAGPRFHAQVFSLFTRRSPGFRRFCVWRGRLLLESRLARENLLVFRLARAFLLIFRLARLAKRDSSRYSPSPNAFPADRASPNAIPARDPSPNAIPANYRPGALANTGEVEGDTQFYPAYIKNRAYVKLVAGGDASMPLTTGSGSDGQGQSSDFTLTIDDPIPMTSLLNTTRGGYTLDGW